MNSNSPPADLAWHAINRKSEISIRKSQAFTLIELLIVIAIVAILTSLLLPALSKAKSSGQSVACLSNLKQLQVGYQSYAEDHNDSQPPNKTQAAGLGDVRNLSGSWVVGNAKTDTNTDNIKAGVIYRYVGAAGVYHCPADKSTVRGASGLLRTRSFSLDSWLSSPESFYDANGVYAKPAFYPWGAFKLSEHHVPPPSEVFAFIDENEQSIDAGKFMIEQPAWVQADTSNDLWYSLPADRHQQGCNLSFLDGHAKHWRWEAPKQFKGWLVTPTGAEDLADHRRIQEALPHDLVRQVN